MTGHQIGSGDPADEALAQRLSWNLLDAVRGVGLGRGLDLALRTLFIRWVTLTDPEHGDDWHRLTEAASGDDERMAASPRFDRQVTRCLSWLVRVVSNNPSVNTRTDSSTSWKSAGSRSSRFCRARQACHFACAKAG